MIPLNKKIRKNLKNIVDKAYGFIYNNFCRREEATKYATVAQLVEHLLAKEEVAGSSPVCRSF